MNKLYDRIDWHNNTTPAINETNLNKMSKALDDIDDRVVEIAGTVMETVPEILDLYEDVEGLADHPPIIGNNGDWWTWDTETDEYVDSGIDAGVSVTIGTTTTLSPGSDATVTNSGTDTDPILNFGIPQGVAGADGVGVPSGGTTGQVLKKKSGTNYDTEWGEASSGGHTIINDTGTSMTQRDGLQFSGLNVTDDSVNDKTVVTLPTPDYVDAQYSSSTTYSKGMTCISGNVRYRYKNSTASSGHQPPNATYWEVLSVSDEIGSEFQLIKTINIDSLTTGSEPYIVPPHKTFSYNGMSNVLNMDGYTWLFIVVQWYQNNHWTSWGNDMLVPLDVLRTYSSDQAMNDVKGFGGENCTLTYLSQYYGKEPYLWAAFSSTNYSNTTTKARIQIYMK